MPSNEIMTGRRYAIRMGYILLGFLTYYIVATYFVSGMGNCQNCGIFEFSILFLVLLPCISIGFLILLDTTRKRMSALGFAGQVALIPAALILTDIDFILFFNPELLPMMDAKSIIGELVQATSLVSSIVFLIAIGIVPEDGVSSAKSRIPKELLLAVPLAAIMMILTREGSFLDYNWVSKVVRYTGFFLFLSACIAIAFLGIVRKDHGFRHTVTPQEKPVVDSV